MNVVLKLHFGLLFIVLLPLLVDIHSILMLALLDLLFEGSEPVEGLGGVELEDGLSGLLFEKFLGVVLGLPPGGPAVVLDEVRVFGLEKRKALLEELRSLFVLLHFLLHHLHDVLDVREDLLRLRKVFLRVGSEHLQVQVDVVDEVLGFVEDFGELLSLGPQFLNVVQELHVISDDDSLSSFPLALNDADHEPLDYLRRQGLDLLQDFESVKEVEGLDFELPLLYVGVDCAQKNGVPKVSPNHEKHHHDSGEEILAHEVSVSNGGHRHYHVPNAIPESRQSLGRVALSGVVSLEKQNQTSEVEDGENEGKKHEVNWVVGDEGLHWEERVEGFVIEDQVDSLQPRRVVLRGVEHLIDLVGYLDEDQSDQNVID